MIAWEHLTPLALAHHAAALARGEPSSPLPGSIPLPQGTTPSALSAHIAIAAMGCPLPNGVRSPESFWALLNEGRQGIRQVPDKLGDLGAFMDNDVAVPGKMTTRWGGLLDDVDRFDGAFFGISPREMQQMNPYLLGGRSLDAFLLFSSGAGV